MASWAAKRKTLYFLLFFAAMLFLIAVPSFLIIYEKPSCFDSKQNQGEGGIDCGGPCAKLCRVSALAPSVLWTRALQVSPGVYNVVALVENPNLDLMAKDVSYLFRVYDSNNLLIYERKGTISVPPGGILPVFEGAISTAKRVANRATFEFTEEPFWRPFSGKRPDVRVSDINLLNKDGEAPPRLSAVIDNRSNRSIPSFNVVAILTGVSGNAIAASRTIIDEVQAESKTPVTFTWREPFAEEVAKTEIILELFPTIHY